MKITSSSDWRDSLEFETPVLVADVVDGEPTRCVTCGPESEPRDRTELWVVKHRHPTNHGGFVRFYCAEHRPVVQRPVIAAPVVAGRPPKAPRAAAPREPRVSMRPTLPDTIRAMCPDCFIEVSATGECGNCGYKIA